MIKRIGRFIFTTTQSVFKQDFLGLSAEMAFYSIFSFFPFLIFVVTLFSVFGSEQLINSIVGYLEPIMPYYIHDYVSLRLNEIINTNAGFMTITFFISMIIASNAMFAMIKGLNSAYHVRETRPLWFTRIMAVGMLFLTAFVIFFGTNIVIFGKFIMNYILSLNVIPLLTLNLISILRWPLIFFALYAVFFTSYYFLPNVKGKKRAKFCAAIPGTFFFCLAWILSSWLFGVYLNHINMYNKFFGAMGVLAIFLMWLYYTSFIFLLGGEINSRFYKKLKNAKKPLTTVI